VGAADRLSPFKFYQYLLTNVGDAEVINFLRMLTFLPLEELDALEASMANPGYAPNTAQRLLASEVTRFVHRQQGLDQALKATQACPYRSLSSCQSLCVKLICWCLPASCTLCISITASARRYSMLCCLFLLLALRAACMQCRRWRQARIRS
jgi:hypothetical protein